MYFVISVNVNNCYKKMNAKLLEIAYGLQPLLEQVLEHVQLIHAVLILFNKNVHKLKDVFGMLYLLNKLQSVHLTLVVVV